MPPKKNTPPPQKADKKDIKASKAQEKKKEAELATAKKTVIDSKTAKDQKNDKEDKKVAAKTKVDNKKSNTKDQSKVDKKDEKRKPEKALDAPQPVKKIKDQEKIVTVISKGGAAVDNFVIKKEQYRVYQQAGKIYSATLNQSNLDANNNKFYIIQILQHQKSNALFVFNRWGRVGVPGQNALKGPMDKISAIKEYQTKHTQKTVKGDYKQIEIKFDDQQSEKKPAKKVKQLKTGTSKMAKSLQQFINLIFDTNIMNTTMKEIGYDVKKMPLGKLGEGTIKEAYTVLNKLSKAIKANNYEQIKSLSSDFYTLIPHDFGFQKMINFILDNDQKVKGKIKMLEAISDMKITTKLLENQNSEEDVVDQNYKKLNCKIDPLDKSSKEFKLLSDYLHNTKQSWKIDIDEIFKIHREIEDKVFNEKIGNRLLLWHGSRITNFVGILSQGLRIAPPEAPVSGYLFGKGIYLADMIDKSAHYCRSYGSDTALVLLIEGAIGNPNVLLSPSYSAKEEMEKNKKDSTKCHGRMAPHESSYVKLDGVQVPMGKPQQTKSGSSMGHNEFILYNTNQARIKYVIRMRMK